MGAFTRWCPPRHKSAPPRDTTPRRSFCEALAVVGRRRDLHKDAAGTGTPAGTLRLLRRSHPRPDGTGSVPLALPLTPLGRTSRPGPTGRPLLRTVAAVAVLPAATRVLVGPTGGPSGLRCRRRCSPSTGSSGRTLSSTPASRCAYRPSDTGLRSEVAACASPAAHPFLGFARMSRR